jgi:hypothetical protein
MPEHPTPFLGDDFDFSARGEISGLKWPRSSERKDDDVPISTVGAISPSGEAGFEK